MPGLSAYDDLDADLPGHSPSLLSTKSLPANRRENVTKPSEDIDFDTDFDRSMAKLGSRRELKYATLQTNGYRVHKSAPW